jgi:DNA polymerase-3 subunit epsilon
MDFIAIDFETANYRRDSACQLAAVVVQSNQIVQSAMWMIRPEPFHFQASNIRIHGITPASVQHEPTFGGHWPEISQFLQCTADNSPGCMVAHNAGFDLGVMLGCLQAHAIDAPEMHYTCTRMIGRRAWPGRTSYSIKSLAQMLGIHFRHHDALEDAVTCAKIMLAAANEIGVGSLHEMEKKLNLSRGRAGQWGMQGPKGICVSRARQQSRSKQ